VKKVFTYVGVVMLLVGMITPLGTVGALGATGILQEGLELTLDDDSYCAGEPIELEIKNVSEGVLEGEYIALFEGDERVWKTDCG
jgi:hypothetical protein